MVKRIDEGRVRIRPNVLSGQPCLRDLRISVSRVAAILMNYPMGSHLEIVADFPYLEAADLVATRDWIERNGLGPPLQERTALDFRYPEPVADPSVPAELLLDLSLPPACADLLTQAGWPAKHVSGTSFMTGSDEAVTAQAAARGQALVGYANDMTATAGVVLLKGLHLDAPAAAKALLSFRGLIAAAWRDRCAIRIAPRAVEIWALE